MFTYNVLMQTSAPHKVSAEGMTDEEREMRVGREKDKGNEAFNSRDFEEALTYYSRSISLIRTAASINNRVLAYHRLEKWEDVRRDCDEVVMMEEDNLKAKFLPASSLKKLEKSSSQTWTKRCSTSQAQDGANRFAKYLCYKLILDKVSLDQIPVMVSNKTTDHVIVTFAHIAQSHIDSSEFDRAFLILQHLARAQGFDMAAMFFSYSDKNIVGEVFASLANSVESQQVSFDISDVN
ncbi:unnamed protein product [Clavelina lepadiformis]|uniref:RNA-polymerase II-associated protein 3-like C-terminal domain-containing protein n=1 Tax=Clavelina lepadiformis TaxID=159417 RepID=A0ABP0GBT8_CLALP